MRARSLGAIAGARSSLAIKEDQAIFLAIAGALGAWWFRGTMRGRVARGIAVASVLVCVAYFAFIQPHARRLPQRMATVPLLRVERAGRRAARPRCSARLGFILLAFVPLLFLPFRSACGLAAAPLAEVLFSRMPTTYTLGTHYAGAWIGYVLVRVRLCGCAISRARCASAARVHRALRRRADGRRSAASRLEPARRGRRDVALDAFLPTLPQRRSRDARRSVHASRAARSQRARCLPETSVPD